MCTLICIFLFIFSRYQSWSITDIQGAIVRLTEYRFVKVPSSRDSEGDSIILVIEDFEHEGCDGSSVFGDPRYISCNPAIRSGLQRRQQAVSSASLEHDNIFSFTQSLDPTDLLFLESTCTQTFQKHQSTFPQVIDDSDWRIPFDQIKILEGIELLKLAKFEFYPEVSDVELSEEDVYTDVNELNLSDTKRVNATDKSFNIENNDEKVSFSLTQAQSTLDFSIQSQFPITQNKNNNNNTQAPFTQYNTTQTYTNSSNAKINEFVTQISQASSTQTPPLSGPVLFPETQVFEVQVPAPSPLTIENKSSFDLRGDSSPINSPIKSIKSSPSPSKKQKQSPTVNKIKDENEMNLNLLMSEYPDYSSW